MANISLSKENIKYIRDAFSHFFPEDTVYSADKPYTSGEFNWNNRRKFIDYVYRLTGVQIKSEKDFENIKKAQLAVEKLVETSETVPEKNRPTKEQLETLEEESRKGKEAQQKTEEEAKKNVKGAIKTKKELAQKASQNKTDEGMPEAKQETPQPTQPIPNEQTVITTQIPAQPSQRGKTAPTQKKGVAEAPEKQYKKEVSLPEKTVESWKETPPPAKTATKISAVLEEVLKPEKTTSPIQEPQAEAKQETPQPTQPILEEQPTTATTTPIQPIHHKKGVPTQKKEITEEKTEKRPIEEVLKKKPVENTRKSIESLINKEQEVQGLLLNKKVYAKVEISKVTPPPQESTLRFIEQAKQYPASFQKELAENIKVKITPQLSSKLSVEEIELIASKTSLDTISAINDFPSQSSANTQTAILKALAKDTEILPKVVSNSPATELLKKASAELGYFTNSTQLSKNILSSVNENLALNVFGVGPENLTVFFSDQPTPGYNHEIDLGKLSQGHIDLLENQSNTLDNLSSFAGDKAKGFFTGQARSFIDSKITKLPTESAVRVVYNSEIGQQVLSFAGLGKTTPIGEGVLGEKFFGTVIQQIPGGTAFLERVGGMFGIDIAAKIAAPTAIESIVVLTEGAEIVGETAAIGTGIATIAGSAIGVETEAVTKLLTPIAGKTVATALTKIATSVLGKGVMAAVNTALQSLGSLVPIIGNAIAAAVGWVAGKIIEKINWKKVREYIAPILGATAGLVVLPFVGLGTAVVVAVGTTVVAVSAGAGAGSLTVGAVVIGVTGFVVALARGFAKVVILPFLIVLLCLPVVVVFILFIINSGAYIVPPSRLKTLGTNPYIQVDKVADPAGPFENTSLPLKINYTVTVTAKISTLTNISFKNECQIMTSGPTKNCPSVTPSDIPASISPSIPYTFTYSETYSGNDYKDSIVLDTFTVDADAQGSSKQEVSGSASVSIGKPPTACLTINEKEWPSQYYANLVNARSILISKYSSYVSKVCMSYTFLELKYNPLGFGGYWGWNHGTYIDFFPAGVVNQASALYTLSHELGHSFAWGSKTAQFYQIYLETPGITGEAPYCFYSATQYWNEGESMPESIALYVIEPRCGSVQQKWPIHYQFLMKYVFN